MENSQTNSTINTNNIKNGHLFKYQVEKLEKEYNTRPEFISRLNRHKFDNIRRMPANICTGYFTKGWCVKGFIAYAFFYYLFKRSPVTPYWNREGYYSYDSSHHTYKSDTVRVNTLFKQN